LANSFFNTAMLGASGEIPTITQIQTNSDTSSLSSNTFTFTGIGGSGGDIPKGTFIVVVLVGLPASFSLIGTWTSLVDAAGNTYTEAVEGTQSNERSFAAIYYSKISNDLPRSTQFTAISSISDGSASYNNRKIARTFILTGVNDLDNVQALAQGNTINHTNSAVTSRGKGIAIYSLSTPSARELFSVNNDFVENTGISAERPYSFCVTKILNEDAGTNVSCSIALSEIGASSARTTRTASLFATFK